MNFLGTIFCRAVQIIERTNFWAQFLLLQVGEDTILIGNMLFEANFNQFCHDFKSQRPS